MNKKLELAKGSKYFISNCIHQLPRSYNYSRPFVPQMWKPAVGFQWEYYLCKKKLFCVIICLHENQGKRERNIVTNITDTVINSTFSILILLKNTYNHTRSLKSF